MNLLVARGWKADFEDLRRSRRRIEGACFAIQNVLDYAKYYLIEEISLLQLLLKFLWPSRIL